MRNGKRQLPLHEIRCLQRAGLLGHVYIKKLRRSNAADSGPAKPAIQRKLRLLQQAGAPIDFLQIAAEYGVTPNHVRAIWKDLLDGSGHETPAAPPDEPEEIRRLQRQGYWGSYYIPQPRKSDAAGHTSSKPFIQRKLRLLQQAGAPIDFLQIAAEYGVTPARVRGIWKSLYTGDGEKSVAGGTA